MTPPPVLVNTYVQVGKPYIDWVSKMFMICGLPFGIIRLPLLGVSPVLTLLLAVYSIGIATYMIIFYQNLNNAYLLDVAIGSSIIQSIIVIALNLISIRRLRRYYAELTLFDKEVGCVPKIAKGTIRNLVQLFFMILYMVTLYTLPHFFKFFGSLYLENIPAIVCHVLEVHFYGHLLSLLIPRLRLINYYMELSLSNANITRTTNGKEFGFTNGSTGNKSLCKMEKLMNLYHTMIKSYNYLIEAIKWQLLVIIIASFISILCYCYHVSYGFIKDEGTISLTAPCLGLSVGLMLPLFAPCTLGDQVHNEVRRLRELLASRLYENQLDKSSRGMARALLAWTETRDLSFSLLRMLNIDISLPFKFVGLLVTYLIILLQFQKVINPT